MKTITKIAFATIGLPALLFGGCTLILGRPTAAEPGFLKRIRCSSMWAEAIGVFGYGLWHPRLLRSGATGDEKEKALPGDCLIPCANHSATYGITIEASRDRIWPWLVQMGEGRALWYAWSPLHAYPQFQSHVSPCYINPDWQELRLGDVLLDGDAQGNCSETRGAWRVAEIQDRRAIVFYSARDLVEGREFNPQNSRPRGMYAITSWTFFIKSLGAGRSRLLIRVRAEVGPRLVIPIARLVFGNYDRVWERTILEGVKYRAENCGSLQLSEPKRIVRR